MNLFALVSLLLMLLLLLVVIALFSLAEFATGIKKSVSSLLYQGEQLFFSLKQFFCFAIMNLPVLDCGIAVLESNSKSFYSVLPNILHLTYRSKYYLN